MPCRILLDLNETLVRTGETSREDQLVELQNLWRIKAFLGNMASRLERVELVLLTGNSFEYSRRIEEPLGWKNLPGLEVVIVSENGLIARSFKRGELWRLEPAGDYRQSVARFLSIIPEGLWSQLYRQGNEVRQTLKPVANRFSEEVQSELERHLVVSGVGLAAQVYTHPFYLDIDPRRVSLGQAEFDFTGKGWAVEELNRRDPASIQIAIGDSASDFPMYRAAILSGGQAFHVANGTALPPELASQVRQLRESYSAGVLKALSEVTN